MRRASFECLSSCTAGTDSCIALCGTDKSTCESRCNNVKGTCDFQCELISEDENVDDETGGTISEVDVTTESTSNLSTSTLLLYLGIGFVAVLCLCGCGFAIFCLLRRNRVKTADADSYPQYAEEQTRMVRQPYVQDKRDWRSSDLYDPSNQISGAPYQGEPAYQDY